MSFVDYRKFTADSARATLQELEHLGVGFVALTEALELTTPAGRHRASNQNHTERQLV
jgi:hypothetical protein